MVLMTFRNYNQEMAGWMSGAERRKGHSTSLVSTLNDRAPVPQPIPLDEAEVKWGKPSQFSWGRNKDDFAEGIVPSTTWEIGDNPEDPQPPDDPDDPAAALEPLTDEWTEIERQETTVRINGPDGAYVDFARIDSVKFKLPNLSDGREHFVVMNFKTAGTVGTTPTPPGAGSGGSGASGAVGVGSDGVIRDPAGGGASL